MQGVMLLPCRVTQRTDPQRKTASLRILLADDDPDILSSLSSLLESDGHIIRSVSDGGAVLPAVEEFRPHVCILDIAMPVVSGYAAAAELRKVYGPERLVLIAHTGQWTLPSEQALAATVGFDHFLIKPADPQYVLALLQELALRL
jgi:CheY-like chemotaxis protein